MPEHDLSRIGRVSVAGGEIPLYAEGEGEVLLMLHGWPLDHRIFQPQVGRLARRYRVVSLDRRGFGASTAPPNLRLELDDVDRVLQYLGAEHVHILGMSQGARVALRFAATRPERVTSLILQGAVVDGLETEVQPEERIPLDHYAKLVRAGNLDEMIRQWLAHPLMHLDPALAAQKALVNSILADYRGDDLLLHDPSSYAFPQNLLQLLRGSKLPVLLLTGQHETAARKAHATALLELLGRAQEVLFPDSGHLSNLTDADSYNTAVLSFLEALGRESAA